MMKAIKRYKGFVIALDKDGVYHLFLKHEWSMGRGYRNEEWYTDNLPEAIGWIDCY